MRMTEYYRKWAIGPLRDYEACREYAHTIGAMRNTRPGMSRNHYLDHVDAISFIYDWKGRENIYISIAAYNPEKEIKGYPYLYFDFDCPENPELAISKGLEFARSVKNRYAAHPVTYLSGFKGLGVIIPLKTYVDWDTYTALWRTLIQPYNYLGKLIDTNVLDRRRLHRIPYTYNIKKGVRRLSRLISLNRQIIRPGEFDWDNYEPLDPGQVAIYRIKAELPLPRPIYLGGSKHRMKKLLPRKIEDLANTDSVPPCIRNIIDTMIKSGDIDHYARLVLVWYLKWTGFTVDNVVDFYRRYAKDYNERITRYQVEYAFGLKGSRKNYLMPSCRWMKEHGLCLECGWDRNPITYTYSKALVNEEIKELFYRIVRSKAIHV